MSKISERITYRIIKMGKNEPLPFNPIVRLELGWWATAEQSKAPTLSEDLMTEEEVDSAVQTIVDSAVAAGRKAKAALRQAQSEAKNYKSP